MKKRSFLKIAGLTIIGSTGIRLENVRALDHVISESNALRIDSHENSFNVTQNKPAIELDDKASWSLVVIPDTQTTIKYDYYQPISDLVMQWIKHNAERMNIKLVLCTGDLVDQNNTFEPYEYTNQTALQQWQFISKSFSILDNTVPYIVCTGNHDYGTASAENRYTQLNSFFNPSIKNKTREILAGMLPNSLDEKTYENAWYEFVSPHGVKFLIFSLEFNPRRTIVEEAKKIVSLPKYTDYKVIWLTHSYMKANGERFVHEGYKIRDVTCGEQLWNNLISKTQNSRLLIAGHIAESTEHRGHVAFREDLNEAGKSVAQMVFNAQHENGVRTGNGGDGWIRILEFKPDKKTVSVKTFSPLFDVALPTRHLARRTADYDQFDFIIE